jgi:hypothetical protein
MLEEGEINKYVRHNIRDNGRFGDHLGNRCFGLAMHSLILLRIKLGQLSVDTRI